MTVDLREPDSLYRDHGRGSLRVLSEKRIEAQCPEGVSGIASGVMPWRRPSGPSDSVHGHERAHGKAGSHSRSRGLLGNWFPLLLVREICTHPHIGYRVSAVKVQRDQKKSTMLEAGSDPPQIYRREWQGVAFAGPLS